jgi:hypothetical protein
MYMTNGNHTFDPVANIYLFLWTFDTAAIFPHVSVPPLMFHDQRLCQFRRQPGPIRGDRIYVPPLRTRKPIYYSSISYVALQQQGWVAKSRMWLIPTEKSSITSTVERRDLPPSIAVLNNQWFSFYIVYLLLL